MNAHPQIRRTVEVGSDFDQFVSRTIAYLDPDNQNPPRPLTYWEDAESLITVIVFVGGAFVSYCTLLSIYL